MEAMEMLGKVDLIPLISIFWILDSGFWILI